MSYNFFLRLKWQHLPCMLPTHVQSWYPMWFTEPEVTGYVPPPPHPPQIIFLWCSLSCRLEYSPESIFWPEAVCGLPQDQRNARDAGSVVVMAGNTHPSQAVFCLRYSQGQGEPGTPMPSVLHPPLLHLTIHLPGPGPHCTRAIAEPWSPAVPGLCSRLLLFPFDFLDIPGKVCWRPSVASVSSKSELRIWYSVHHVRNYCISWFFFGVIAGSTQRLLLTQCYGTMELMHPWSWTPDILSKLTDICSWVTAEGLCLAPSCIPPLPAKMPLSLASTMGKISCVLGCSCLMPFIQRPLGMLLGCWSAEPFGTQTLCSDLHKWPTDLLSCAAQHNCTLQTEAPPPLTRDVLILWQETRGEQPCR